MQPNSEPIKMSAPGVDQPPLFAGEREERGKLELVEFVPDLPHAEIR